MKILPSEYIHVWPAAVSPLLTLSFIMKDRNLVLYFTPVSSSMSTNGLNRISLNSPQVFRFFWWRRMSYFGRWKHCSISVQASCTMRILFNENCRSPYTAVRMCLQGDPGHWNTTMLPSFSVVCPRLTSHFFPFGLTMQFNEGIIIFCAYFGKSNRNLPSFCVRNKTL